MDSTARCELFTATKIYYYSSDNHKLFIINFPFFLGHGQAELCSFSPRATAMDYMILTGVV